MAERLCSVGLDVGTTTTQLIVSELTIENKASAFAVPEMTITDRRILYRSPVHFTPQKDAANVDGDAIRRLVEQEYAAAGITREDVDTGAIIITGETSRKENAGAVLAALSDHAGEFVVATAGPHLESVLAARGAGAVALSAHSGKTVLHMDIGGGTANLARIEDGRITQTGCMNVGGRLLKFDSGGKITYVSPVLSDLTELRAGDHPTQPQIEAIAKMLTEALEMAAGLRETTQLFESLWTKEAGVPWTPMPVDVICFSGGVADCIAKEHPALQFGDIGPPLGNAIRSSRLCEGEYILGSETIRATVIGAGCHSTQLSGSTVFFRNIEFPLKNLPVAAISASECSETVLSELIRRRMAEQDTTTLLALSGLPAADYSQVKQLAKAIARGIPDGAVYLALEQDVAKALGQALCLELGANRPLLCLDGLRLEAGSYLDVAAPVGPALPVVVKTLILEK